MQTPKITSISFHGKQNDVLQVKVSLNVSGSKKKKSDDRLAYWGARLRKAY